MNFNAKLQLLRKNIKGGYELMGSRWKSFEAETIAMQTITACALNLEQHGEAFSWQGSGTLGSSGNGLVDNPHGVKLLLGDESIILEPYDNPKNIQVPEGTVRHTDGRPMVFRCTERLLDHAMALMNLQA